MAEGDKLTFSTTSAMAAVVLVLSVATCASDDGVFASTTEVGGRVVVAGPTGALRGARVSVDQLEPARVQHLTNVLKISTSEIRNVAPPFGPTAARSARRQARR